MLTRDQVDTLVNNHGFILWATERKGSEVEYHYMERRYGINLWVNPETQTFRMECMINHSLFSLKCPECSPISNEDHFGKMLRRFKKAVRVMVYHNPFGEDD